jgi:parallel beta-helix repeat protein
LLIEDSIVHDNYGTPISCYDNAGSLKVYENIIRGNIVYDNHALPGAGPGANLENAGILVAWGDGNQIYNNFCFRNDIGFQIYTNASNTKVYHNTAYGNVTSGFHFQYMLGDAILKNNIAYNNPTPVVEADSIGGVVIASNNITADPSFVDAAAGDFRLQSGSVARNAGANLLAVVPTDANGVARDTVPDCGALEFV